MAETFEREARRYLRENVKRQQDDGLLRKAFGFLSGGSQSDVSSLFEALAADPNATLGLLLVRRAFHDELAILDDHCSSKIDYELLPELEGWYNESAAECASRLDSLECPEHFVAVDMQQLVDSGTEVLDIRLIQNTPSGQVKQCVWDVRTIETPFAVELAYLWCDVPDLISFRKGRSRSFAPGPLYHLHPERFKQTRSYYKTALNRIGKMDRERTLSADMNRANEPIMASMQKEGVSYPLRAKLANPQPGAVHMSVEFEITWFLYKFVGAGRQIFSLSTELVEMFRNTSVDDIPVADLVSPYTSYYLHFGRQEDLSVGDGWFLDGAYVEHLPDLDLIQFGFTAVPSDPKAVLNWHSMKEPWRTLALKDQSSESLGAAVRTLIAEKRAEIEEKISKGNQDITQDLQKLAEETGDDVSYKKIIDVAETSGKLELTDFERNLPSFQKALDIVVNAMCYLTAYRDDIRQQWPNDAPKKLVDKSRTGTPNHRRRATSKLETLGYTKVHFCGNFSAPTQASSADNRSVRTHWRRGHWRSQPYGPGRKLRKMVLIRPILVNAEKDPSDEVPGHIYIGENIPGDQDTVH